jgi:hypothetical protein
MRIYWTYFIGRAAILQLYLHAFFFFSNQSQSFCSSFFPRTSSHLVRTITLSISSVQIMLVEGVWTPLQVHCYWNARSVTHRLVKHPLWIHDLQLLLDCWNWLQRVHSRTAFASPKYWLAGSWCGSAYTWEIVGRILVNESVAGSCCK